MHNELPSPTCLEGFPFDPDFPQLVLASDPARMLAVFREHLKPAVTKPYFIEECVPFRFRIRQSTSRCVLQYTLRVVDPDSGCHLEQWATGIIFAETGKAEQLWRDMQASEPLRDFPERWLTFEPVSFLPDLRMVVELFPYDRRLRNLRAVLDGGMAAELEPRLLARLGAGDWRTLERAFEPVRHRTELGAVLRHTLTARERQTGRIETLRSYLKVYRGGHGAEKFRSLQALVDRCRERRSPYSVAPPLAYCSRLDTLVLEEAPGTVLYQVLQQDVTTLAARTVARAVVALDQDDLETTLHHTLADQLEDVKRASSLVQWACPQVRDEVKAITAAVVSELLEVPPGTIHRDLKPDHVFLTEDQVVFVDMDSVARGDPARDPAHLWAHIVAQVNLETLSRERAHAAADAFVDEYFAHVPTPWRAQFPLHCAGALIEVAVSLFRRQVPQWREKVRATIEEARLALGRGSS